MVLSLELHLLIIILAGRRDRVIDNVGWNRAVCPVTRLNIVYSTFQSAASRELSGGYPFGAD